MLNDQGGIGMSNKKSKLVKLTPTPDGWAPVDKIKVDKDSGPHLISFELPQNQTTISFDRSDPIWVQAGSKPTKKTEHDQIPAWVVTEDGKELVLLDLNDNDSSQGTLELHYQLNFASPTKPLDPIIENGGGPKLTSGTETGARPGCSPIEWDSTTLVVAALAAVILLIVGGLIGRALKG
jgi:hypothetical protein